jgi:hypothetical protein
MLDGFDVLEQKLLRELLLYDDFPVTVDEPVAIWRELLEAET